jgi:hypothetical protein
MRVAGVSVVVRGEALDPSRLTSILEVEPSDARAVGEEEQFDLDGTYFPSSGWWRFDTGDRIRDSDVRAHLAYVISRLRGLREAAAASKADECRFSIRLAREDTELPEPETIDAAIGADLLADLNELGLRMGEIGW